MWIGNLMLVILNLPPIGPGVKPDGALLRAVLEHHGLRAIGVYSVNSNVFDLYAVAFFGFIGYVLVKLLRARSTAFGLRSSGRC